MKPSWSTLGAAALLCLYMALAGGAALRESVTVDEVAHIGAGVSYLQKFDLRLNPEHPPLPKMIAALPLVLKGTRADYSSPAWRTSESFIPAYLGQWVFGDWLLSRWNDLRSTLMWSRIPMLIVATVLGWVVWLYAKRLGGPVGGLLCLTAYVTAPVFLTFGPLVITDIPVTLFSVVALWQLAEVWNQPTRRNAVLFGLALAGALLSKFTGSVLFVGVLAFTLHSRRWRVSTEPADKTERRSWRRLRWRTVLQGLGWAAAAVYLFYLVFSWNQPNNAVDRVPTDFLRRLLMPAWLYLRGLLLMLAMSGRPTFLLGHSYSHGVPFYFPVVLALKSSLGFLGLIGIAIGVAAGHRKYRSSQVIPSELRIHWRVICVGFVVFTAVCFLSPLNISLRHFTVPIVLLILLMAPVPRMLAMLPARRLLQAATAVFAALCLITAVSAYPYYFAYINALGMHRPAYTLVNDSNVDWNQGLYEVEAFVRGRGLKKINLDYLGMADPVSVVPEAVVWDCQAPKESDAGQWVILSATMILENHNCGWLQRYPQQMMAGGSLYAVHLPAQIPKEGTEGGPPPPSARKLLFGSPTDIRTLFLDVDRHPETLPAVMENMMREYQKQQEERQKKKK